ncbi:MAG: hypothetical protein AAGB04_07200, partial [Pseudomonadota bacterium]
AIEMILATHAIRLREVESLIAPGLRPLVEQIQVISPLLEADRPLSGEIDTVAEWIRNGEIDRLTGQV